MEADRVDVDDVDEVDEVDEGGGIEREKGREREREREESQAYLLTVGLQHVLLALSHCLLRVQVHEVAEALLRVFTAHVAGNSRAVPISAHRSHSLQVERE